MTLTPDPMAVGCKMKKVEKRKISWHEHKFKECKHGV